MGLPKPSQGKRMTNLRSFKRSLAIGIGVGVVLGAGVGSAMQSVGFLFGLAAGAMLGAGFVLLLASSKDNRAKRWKKH
jgi:hypothetical protein